jgi:trimethylamine--corrinoid protein Co-methyltransferase
MKEDLIDRALHTVPHVISLYAEDGKKILNLGDEGVFFMPGGTAPFILDNETGFQRKATCSDLVEFVRLVDSLPHIQINNPAFIISDVPRAMEDSFRCFLTMLYSTKPFAGGGSTGVDSIKTVRKMLAVVAGSEEELQQKPRNYFSCCPTSPLNWDDSSCRKLLYCAANAIPTLIIPAPGVGATAPVTLLGSIMQQAVENLSGVVLHQLMQPGAPVFCGAAATVMDMRSGNSAFAAIESQMVNVATTQIWRYLNMVSHGIVATSDAKTVDAQTGLEAAQGIMMGALGGINLISGMGMIDSGLCQSFAKLIIDNEIGGMVLRLAQGIESTQETLAFDVIREVGPGGQFLTAEHTLQWMRQEHYFPSAVIQRQSQTDLQNTIAPDAYKTAGELAKITIATHESRRLDEDIKKELIRIITAEGRRHGMDRLPDDSITDVFE